MESKLLEIQEILNQDLSLDNLHTLKKDLDKITLLQSYDQSLYNAKFSQVYRYLGKQFQNYPKEAEEAIECYNFSIKLNEEVQNDTKNKIALQSIALLYHGQENYERTLESYQKLAKLMPNQSQILFNIGLVYSKLNEKEKAIEYYKLANQLDDQDQQILQNLGSQYYQKREYETALQYYMKALEVNENDPEMYFSVGVILMKKKEYVAALEYLNEMKQLKNLKDEKYLKAQIQITKIHLLEDKVEKAFEVYRETSNLLATDEKVYTNFSILFSVNGSHIESTKILVEGSKNIEGFLQKIQDKSEKMVVIEKLRKEKSKQMKHQILTMQKAKLFNKYFRKEINEEIIYDYLL